MSAANVMECVSSVVPCARVCWPLGQAPDLPYAVFLADDDRTFMADDAMFATCTRWRVELYERYPDEALETALKRAIYERFGPYEAVDTWIDTEGCYELALYFTECEVYE